MSNFFYFDQNNQKLGPVTEEQLKELATQGAITPQTPMETDTGHKGVAGQIPGMTFGTAAPNPFAQTPPVSQPTSKQDDNFIKGAVIGGLVGACISGGILVLTGDITGGLFAGCVAGGAAAGYHIEKSSKGKN